MEKRRLGEGGERQIEKIVRQTERKRRNREKEGVKGIPQPQIVWHYWVKHSIPP